MSSARDITLAVRPPRSVFLDFPLGHTSGKPHEPELNRAVMRDTLSAFESISQPGTIVDLPYRWSDSDDWKDAVFAPSSARGDAAGGDDAGDAIRTYTDDRVERRDTPQYQCAEDEARAREAHAGRSCLVCAGIDY